MELLNLGEDEKKLVFWKYLVFIVLHRQMLYKVTE